MVVNLVELKIAPKYLWAAGIVWPPIIVSIVVARFCTRYAQKTRLGIDDWLTLPALVLISGVGVNLLVGVGSRSLGYPTPIPVPGTALTSTSREQTIARKVYWISMILDIPALTLLKLSCMLFYSRIFRIGSSRIVGIVFHIIDAFIIVWGLGFWLSFLFPCKTHWEWLWTNLINMAKCPSDLLMMHESLFISNVIMDLIIFVVPIPLVAKLQISTGRKFAVLGVFFLGAMTIAMSIIRLAFTYEQANNQYNPNADENFISTSGLYFMYNEACFALCAICLPTLAGALKLKGVQAIIEGFSTVFSNLSRRSFRSGDSTASAKKPERLGSAHSEALGLVPDKSFSYVNRAEATNDFELRYVGNGASIFVTRKLEQQSLKA